jgi:hypothetical protein
MVRGTRLRRGKRSHHCTPLITSQIPLLPNFMNHNSTTARQNLRLISNLKDNKPFIIFSRILQTFPHHSIALLEVARICASNDPLGAQCGLELELMLGFVLVLEVVLE